MNYRRRAYEVSKRNLFSFDAEHRGLSPMIKLNV